MRDTERVALEARLELLASQGEHARAAEEAIRGFGPELLGYLGALLRDDDRARDVFQLVSEKLWKGLPTFQRRCPVRNWAYQITWNTAQDHLKSTRRRREQRLATTEAGRIALEVRDATRPHARTENRDRLAAARAALAPDEQTLLILRVDRGLAWEEVAEIMSATPAALRKRYERLRARLAQLLGVVDGG
jgi:RNA polymerase sigma-70 factor (ECF subfamily)